MKTKIPLVKGFGDYHDIYAFEDELNEVIVPRIKSKEIAFDGEYWGVFYVSKLPPKDKLKKLLIAAGWSDQFEHSEFLGKSTHYS